MVSKILSLSATCVLLVGCGGGSSSSSEGDASGTTLTGVFLDSAVEGLTYNTETLTGFTNESGEFQYISGENVTFSLGDLIFPTTIASDVVTPVELAAGSTNPADTTTNIARLLQSLDTDGNPDNGITISSTTAASGVAIDFDVSVDQFSNDEAVLNLLSNSGATNTTLIDADTANAHLNATIAGVENTGSNIDLSVELLNNRFLIPTPESFATGKNAYRMNADTRLRVAGIVNGELLYGKFPWTVSNEGEFQVDFREFQDDLVIGYSVISTNDEKITLSKKVIDSDEESENIEFYLSKPLRTSDFSGRKISIANSSISFDFSDQGVVLFTDEVGSLGSGTYEDLTVEGVGFRGPDFFNQVILANGNLDDGLIMMWHYDVNDDFRTIDFFKASGSTWTPISSHSR